MKNFNKILLTAATVFFCGNAMAQGDFPPNAQPGKCYAKCVIPEQWETTSEEVLVKEASSRIEVAPATYQTVSEEIMVKDSYTVLTVTPPSYTTVTEEIMVKEAGSRLEYVPPVYETVSEQMMVSPASTEWKKQRRSSGCQGANPDDCMIWCLVEKPAEYRTVTKQVLKTPASTREIPIPAEFKTITKTVVQNPAQVQENSVPAEFRSITKQVLDRPASANEIAIPAEYKTITSRRLVSPERVGGWTEVNCNSVGSSTRTYSIGASVRDIQSALVARGYNIGPMGVDGVMGSDTRAAINKFAADNGISASWSGTSVPDAVLKALGLK